MDTGSETLRLLAGAAGEAVPKDDRDSYLLLLADLLRGATILDALRSLGFAKGRAGSTRGMA